jgi:hypothetical protein
MEGKVKYHNVSGKCSLIKLTWLANILSFVIQNLTQHIHWQS